VQNQFDQTNYKQLCNELGNNDADLKRVIDEYSYPPFWERPNTFESLVHIILEQQVSLASALSALNKLKERIREITPARVLSLTDEELRACYFSRQKIGYVRHLADHILSGVLNLGELALMGDEVIRQKLCA
jgi:DNA-3-methyladenine glycosylase II